MPASVALLERARAAGHRLTLLSNMPRPYADHLEARTPVSAGSRPGVFSGRVGLMKPERAMFDHAARRSRSTSSTRCSSTITPANIDAARAFGWQALRFENAAQCEAALRRDGWL